MPFPPAGNRAAQFSQKPKEFVKAPLIIFVTCCFLAFFGAIVSARDADAARQLALRIGENFRIYPSPVTQTEVFITTHPGDPQTLFAAANAISFQPFFISEGVYVSRDGGQTWTGSDTLNDGDFRQFHGGDPGIAMDNNGRLIVTRLGRSPFAGLYANFSTDFGQTWSAQRTITTDDLERAVTAHDGFAQSPFQGRTYTAWVRFATPFPVVFSRSDDGAESWQAPVQINHPSMRNAGGDMAIGRDGSVHLCWAGVAPASPFTEIFVGYARSDNGGDDWQVHETAFEMNGIQGTLPEKANIRVNGLPRIAIDNSGGPRNGWIYLVTTEKDRAPAGSDPDIILHRSSDGGQSWSPGIRVNQDLLNNGKIQYFPAIAVDHAGGVNVIYYDDRTTTSDSTGLFLARSTDGGDSWQEWEISDRHFQPVPIGGMGQGYQGDNIDLTVAGNTLWPVWMDNRNGIYQIWTAPVELETVSIADEAGGPPDGFALHPNFPNPFNPATTITYRLPLATRVALDIFDISGRKIRTLATGQRRAGFHQAIWDGRDQLGQRVSSGIYLYQIKTADFRQIRKMVLLR